MNRRATALGALVTGLLLVATTVPAQGAPVRRGELLSVTAVADLDTTEVGDTVAPIASARTRYPVKAYRIEYRTVDVRDRPTTASALVALPVGRKGRARTVVWEHGTRTGRADVASVSGDNVDRPASVLFATAGYVTVAPDYLGLGTGPGPHPYVHSATEAGASVDALRAGRVFASGQRQHLSDDVLVSGFSQGGHAAMALGQALSRSSLRLRALAPISGPYDLAGTEIPGLFDGRVDPYAGAFYLAYWTVSNNLTYGLYRSPAEVFRPPYDRTLPALFDGTHDENEIFPALPASPQQLVTATYAARLQHPEGALRRAIQENTTTCRWTPRAPVRLYAATGDTQVPIGNAEECRAELEAHGARPALVDLGAIDHLDEPGAALAGVVAWFDRVS